MFIIIDWISLFDGQSFLVIDFSFYLNLNRIQLHYKHIKCAKKDIKLSTLYIQKAQWVKQKRMKQFRTIMQIDKVFDTKIALTVTDCNIIDSNRYVNYRFLFKPTERLSISIGMQLVNVQSAMQSKPIILRVKFFF